MQRALQDQGVQAAFLSKTLSIDFSGVEIDDPFFSYKPPSLLKRLKNKLNASSSKEQNFQRLVAALQPPIKAEIVTSPESDYDLLQHPLVQQADIIHLHWVNGILDYQSFFAAINKPVYWTLHDMNPFLGIFHYAGDEARNKGKSAHELNESFKVLKKEAYSQARDLHLLFPSTWLKDAAKASGIFPRHTAYDLLANGIDQKPYERFIFSEEIGQTAPLKLIYVSDRLDNYRMGADLLQAALAELTIPMELMTMGAGALKIDNPNIQVNSLGYIDDEADKIKVIGAADALLIPSREDNLPNTMLEALAAGTPVIGFEIGGLAEHIQSGLNGQLSKEVSAAGLVKAIETFGQQKQEFKRSQVKAYAQEHFDVNNQAKKLLNRYLEPQNNPQKLQLP
ncbi:glycosyltransferase [Gilvibacter sp.]|uniref:glycosyltransferase n=1 Tax=Gilvibacter sp. TaxID=2729997 RepID=UPI0025BF21FE|nr:glycosyltransferase [Gilvibacter sp.]NQX78903.1 glycosyltransferase [Gilvibacter sp.]